MEIKGEVNDVNEQISDVKKTQETATNGFSNIIDVKMSEVKDSIEVKMTSVKENMGKNEALLTKMQVSQSQLESKLDTLNTLRNDVEANTNILSNVSETQKAFDIQLNSIDQKLVTLNDKSCDIEINVIKQKRCTDQTIQNLSKEMHDMEYGLAAHIEVIKGNMEKELTGAKENQIFLETKLSDFTNELDHQNQNLNLKIQTLRSDFEQLKTRTDNIDQKSDPISTYNSFSNISSPNDCTTASQSNSSMYSASLHNDYDYDHASPDVSQRSSPMYPANTSCSQEYPPHELNDHVNENDQYYIYGDTTKTVIIDGLVEDKQENLGEIITRCVNEIGIPLTLPDIDNVFRIGRFNPNRDRPRPVKVTLRDRTKRDQIFIFKARLRFTEEFKDLRVNKEQRKDIRVKAAKMRQAGEAAKKMGYKVEARPGQIKINGIEYNSIDSIPEVFMAEANEIRNPPVNTRRLTVLEKCRTRSTNIIKVGPSLQKTPSGLAFYSSSCFLSNFYPTKFYFRGQPYTSLEQGYQCTKAKIYEDEVAFEAILGAQTPAQMKQIGREIVVNQKWGNLRLVVMEDLLFAKFRQNKKIYYSLLNTRPMNLIEATLDGFWGAGCLLESIALEESCWEGQNQLGKLLVKVRTILVRELEIAQGSIK